MLNSCQISKVSRVGIGSIIPSSIDLSLSNKLFKIQWVGFLTIEATLVVETSNDTESASAPLNLAASDPAEATIPAGDGDADADGDDDDDEEEETQANRRPRRSMAGKVYDTGSALFKYATRGIRSNRIMRGNRRGDDTNVTPVDGTTDPPTNDTEPVEPSAHQA